MEDFVKLMQILLQDLKHWKVIHNVEEIIGTKGSHFSGCLYKVKH